MWSQNFVFLFEVKNICLDAIFFLVTKKLNGYALSSILLLTFDQYSGAVSGFLPGGGRDIFRGWRKSPRGWRKKFSGTSFPSAFFCFPTHYDQYWYRIRNDTLNILSTAPCLQKRLILSTLLVSFYN